MLILAFDIMSLKNMYKNIFYLYKTFPCFLLLLFLKHKPKQTFKETQRRKTLPPFHLLCFSHKDHHIIDLLEMTPFIFS